MNWVLEITYDRDWDFEAIYNAKEGEELPSKLEIERTELPFEDALARLSEIAQKASKWGDEDAVLDTYVANGRVEMIGTTFEEDQDNFKIVDQIVAAYIMHPDRETVEERLAA